MHLPTASRSRRDSWPPTQIRLDPVLPVDDPSMEDIEHNPLAYFLSPAPSIEDMDVDDDMEFDAGIEDLNNPREIVRSVSPSSLNGLSRPVTKRPSPEPELSDGTSPWDDDSEEEYIRFQPNTFGLPFTLRDFTIDGIKSKPRAATAPPTTSLSRGKVSEALLSPSSLQVLGARGRTPARGPGRGRTRSLSARRRPQHLWREPSPDVWSIEEETEEEVNSDIGSNVADEDAPRKEDEDIIRDTEEHLEVPAAKPKKKVRFVLPVKD